jgi:UPF0755 protein
MRRTIVWPLVLLLVLTAGGAMLFFYGLKRFEQPGPTQEAQLILVPEGASMQSIAQKLATSDLIADPLIFEIAARIKGEAQALKAGEFEIPAAASMADILKILTEGEVYVRRITFAEGLSSAEILDMVGAAEGLEGDLPESLPEGSLLPETYHYVRGDTRGDLLARMRAARDAALDELWTERAEGLPVESKEEAVILASIVEKETALADERPQVAAVFLNRLKRGMPLQSDPTVVYGLTQGKEPLGRALTYDDLRSETAYNTYVIPRLPPGPIANPGRAAIAAVLNPADVSFLYFVADGTGGHAFANTLEEHNRNVANWRKIQKQNKTN